MSVTHPYDVEEIYAIQNKITEVANDINKEYIPRLNDLLHIINVCQPWTHDENLKMLIYNRDELIENIKETIKEKLLAIVNELN